MFSYEKLYTTFRNISKTLLQILMVINCHKNNVLKQSLPHFKMSDNSLVMYICLPRSVHAFVAEKGFVLGGELRRQNEIKVITINIPLQVTWANQTRDNSYLKLIKKAALTQNLRRLPNWRHYSLQREKRIKLTAMVTIMMVVIKLIMMITM